MMPCSVPTDPDQRLDITCAHCGTEIDFRLGEVYINRSSYVCKLHAEGHPLEPLIRRKDTKKSSMIDRGYSQVWGLTKRYLAEKPQHENGFCWWASKKLRNAGAEGVYFAYVVTASFAINWAVSRSSPLINGLVDPKEGPTEVRLAFVGWMRDELLQRLVIKNLDGFLPANIEENER